MCKWLINKLANEGCTYIVMVFSIKLSKTFSTKAFLDGKTPCGHNLHDNLCRSYMDSIVIMDKNFLTTSNIKSSKKPNYVGLSFLNLFKIKKNSNIVDEDTSALFLLASLSSVAFVRPRDELPKIKIKILWLGES
jgi:hypothetical protein